MVTTSSVDLIGDTPLIELRHIAAPEGVRLFAKLEGMNPTGSIKDRIARRILDEGERSGALRPGMTLVEASTGNTAIALAHMAKQRGYGLRIVLPHGVVPAVAQILTTLGVELHWCAPESGTRGAIRMALAMEEAEANVWAVRQFSSVLNVQTHYETTGAEIVAQVDAADDIDSIDVFVAGIGTGGTIMGVGARLRERWPDVRVIGLEPALGEYLQGLRCMSGAFTPPLLDLSQLSGRWLVTAAESIRAAKSVAEREGLLVGVSAGAALHIGLKEAERLQGGGNVVMMFSDSGWKYLPAQPWDAAKAGVVDLDEVHWW